MRQATKRSATSAATPFAISSNDSAASAGPLQERVREISDMDVADWLEQEFVKLLLSMCHANPEPLRSKPGTDAEGGQHAEERPQAE